MFRDLVKFSEKYDSTMFNAYARIWEVANRLSKYWESRGINVSNPFYAEDRALPTVELKEALFILAPYYMTEPLHYFDKRDKLDYGIIMTACRVVNEFLDVMVPKSKTVCICSSDSEFSALFDECYVFSMSTTLTTYGGKLVCMSEERDAILNKCARNNVWVEASRKVLSIAGTRALNFTLYNPYNYEPMDKIMFTGKREYIEEYEDYIVVGWNSAVRQYTYHICDTQQKVINSHFMHFTHETDAEFEKLLTEVLSNSREYKED